MAPVCEALHKKMQNCQRPEKIVSESYYIIESREKVRRDTSGEPGVGHKDAWSTLRPRLVHLK